MGKRKRGKQGDPVRKTGRREKGFGNRPFQGLAVRSEPVGEPKKPAAPPDVRNPESAQDEDWLYGQAMAGVRPLSDADKLAESAPGAKPPRPTEDDDARVMRHLDELVLGEIPFDFTDTDEYIEAAAAGLDSRILRKLRRGDYAWQAHLDLHGLTRDEARDRVAEFIARARRDGSRCVLIIHGRGFGSKEGIPVLKNKLAAWLTRGSIGRQVLAYTSAKPYDGGTGAVYVLLRSPG